MVDETAPDGTPVAVTISIDVPVRMWDTDQGLQPGRRTVRRHRNKPNEETEDQPTSLLFLDVKP